MATFPNVLTTKFLDAMVKERPTSEALRAQYIGRRFFPEKDIGEYQVLWDVVRAANRIAGIYSMDGTPIPGDDPGFYQIMADVMNVMAARKLDEEAVMTLREPGELAIKSRVLANKRNKALRHVRTKLASADDEVEATIEYLCLQALQGTITWPPKDDDGNTITSAPAYWGNASITLDLEFRANFKQDVSSLSGYNSRSGGGYNWKHASADPILDLEVVRDLMANTIHMPIRGATVIMGEDVLSYMATRPNVINWFKGTDTGQRFVNYPDLQDFLETKLGYNILTYSAVWTYETNLGSESGVTENHVHFLKPGKVIIIPPGALGGDIAYLATAPTAGPDQSYKPGKYTWIDVMKKPPWTTELGVGIKGFPVLKSSQEVFVLDVFN